MWVDATIDKRTDFEPIDRIRAVISSYFEVSINFALVYKFFSTDPATFCGAGVKNAFDALYFSGITITTTGYGDISPVGPVRFLCLYEAVSGFVLLVIALAVYASGERTSRRKVKFESTSKLNATLVKVSAPDQDPGETSEL